MPAIPSAVPDADSKMQIGRRLSNASFKMDRAISGRKWWNADNIARMPVNASGTLVASTGSAAQIIAGCSDGPGFG